VSSLVPWERPAIRSRFYPAVVGNLKLADDAMMAGDHYEAISRALTAVALLAYAAQEETGSRWRRAVPMEIEVERGSLPRSLLEPLAREIVGWAHNAFDEIHRAVASGSSVYVDTYVNHPVIKSLVAISRRRGIDEAVETLRELLQRMMSEAGTSRLSGHNNLNLFYSDKVGSDRIKEFRLVTINHWGTNVEKFEEILRDMGFSIRGTQLDEVELVIGRKTVGDVEIVANCGTDGFGYVALEFEDEVPEIPTNIATTTRVGCLVLKPIIVTAPRRIEIEAPITRSGDRYLLDVTQLAKMLGIASRRSVRIVVDIKKRTALIKFD